jgi:hypothetical protein
MIEKKLSIQSGLYLAEPLDTWLTAGNQDFAVPEAAGSSARVFLLKDETGSSAYKRDPAFKVMRHDKISYAKPLFLEEFRILANLQNIQGLTPMLQAGFLKTDAASMWPSELAPLSKDAEQKASAAHVSGTLSLFAPDETGHIAGGDGRKAGRRLASFSHPRAALGRQSLSALRCRLYTR